MVFQEAQDNGSLKGISLDKTPGQMLLSISKAEIFLTSFTLKKNNTILITLILEVLKGCEHNMIPSFVSDDNLRERLTLYLSCLVHK